jgi:transglutaminase-like putative cysteine protease
MNNGNLIMAGGGDNTPAAAIPNAVRRLSIRHATHYTYGAPVHRSLHRLHLRPILDMRQRPVSHSLTIAPAAPTFESEDVFGNSVVTFEVSQPYTELHIEALSEVEIADSDPFAFARTPIRPSFPLVWMPWEQKMLTPYLTSQELPDTQLREIFDYAMSFVEKNNRDLMETLFAINLALFREYKYAPGTTNHATTAFDVLCNKQGVCQDFSNLFICMARLLAIPARYVWGYIYTGNVGQSRASSDATHAWVQLYIPNVGWKDFDPTNGVLPRTDHVRVGVGRNYRDAAPITGTLYSPANEMLKVDVEVRDLMASAPEPATSSAAAA